jgi:predicted house-cleaning noncanonical NTP pyrophosphatase (MazG superfamily)
MEMNDKNLSVFQSVVGEWADDKFPESNRHSIVKHLESEVSELLESHEPEEAADCLLLLMHHAHKGGYDLFDESVKKLEVCKLRKWGQPDEHGVVEHIRNLEVDALKCCTIKSRIVF